MLVLLAGTLFLIIAWNAWRDHSQIVLNGIKTQGIVLENVHKPIRGVQKQTTALAPVVQFSTQDGQLKKYYSQTYTTPATYAPGEILNIWYLPEDPNQATLNGVDAWVLPTVFGIFGSVISLIGMGGLFGTLFKNSNTSTP